MKFATLLNLLSQAFGLISLIILYRASFGVPHDKVTWDGVSPIELAIRSRQKLLGWVGIISGVFAIVFQTILTICA